MRLHRILFVLLTMRLLMPPGICACKWNAPAARLLVGLFGKQVVIPPAPIENDDDHEPGCPASFLSVGMGVWPPAEPLPPLAPAPELLLPAPTLSARASLPLSAAALVLDEPAHPLSDALYLSQCALRF